MITINDIALALNLSTATVSNALSGKGRVSEANRQAVIDKATEMGYDFGRLRLAPQRKTVAVFTESLSVPFCYKITEGVTRAAEQAGYRPVLYNLDLMYESDDYNPPRERVRARMEEILLQDASFIPVYARGHRYFFSQKITPLPQVGDPDLTFCLMQAKFN